RIDATAFKSYISREKQQVEAYKLNPQYLFADSAYNLLYGKNPRAHAFPVGSDFDKILLDHAVKFYNERMNSANGMNYFFVGSFKESEIKPLIEKYIGGMPGTGVNTNYKDLNIDRISGQNSFTLHKGKESKSMIRDYMYGEMPYEVNDELPTNLLSDVINIK